MNIENKEEKLMRLSDDISNTILCDCKRKKPPADPSAQQRYVQHIF